MNIARDRRRGIHRQQFSALDARACAGAPQCQRGRADVRGQQESIADLADWTDTSSCVRTCATARRWRSCFGNTTLRTL
jgi:hypothetical protein